MRHSEYKIFSIFNFEDEEKWLNEKSAKGEHLVDVRFIKYIFEDGEPGKYIYRLEMLENHPNHYSSVKYINFLEETGVEHIASMLKWVYLRKKASDGAFDIYSDLDSKVKHYERIINLSNLLIIIQLLVSIPNVIMHYISGLAINSIYLLNLLFAVIIYVPNRSLKYKVDRLKKEKIYKE